VDAKPGLSHTFPKNYLTTKIFMPRPALSATSLIALISLGALSAAGKEAESVRQTPIVGQKIAVFSLGDFRGKTWSLADFQDYKIVVVAFMGTECPLMTSYGPRLAELAAKYEKQAAFIGINANQQDSLAEIAHFAKKNGWRLRHYREGFCAIFDKEPHSS